MQSEVHFARGLFEEGLPLIGMVGRDLAVDLDLFSRGGLEILRAIERCDLRRADGTARYFEAHQARARHCAQSAARCCRSCALRASARQEGGLTRHDTRRGLRDLPGNREARSEELLLRFRRFAHSPSKCYLRHLCIHAQGRRSGRRRKPLPRCSAASNSTPGLLPGATRVLDGATADPVFIAVRDAIQRFNDSAQSAG